MIVIKDMVKTYRIGQNELNALNGINLHIRQKEFVSIIGPSGSGKSTLMNMIGCLDTPTSGTYLLDGLPIESYNDDQLAEIRNQKIGFIFQGFNLLQKLTALENVELPLIYRGVSYGERHRLAKDALERVGLGDRIHHKPTELSGGQQQRVAIARALCSRPPLILADEPTGNLDTRSGLEVMKMMRELHAEGKTIVLITHDPNVAKQAERVIWIQDGEITQETAGGEVTHA